METWNSIDIALGAIVAISALIGIARGLLKEVLSIAAWGISLYIAYLFAPEVAKHFVHRFIQEETVSYLAAFGGLFLVALFAVGLVNLILGQIIDSAGLGGFDRTLGMFFGILRGFVIGALLAFFASLTPLHESKVWRESSFVPTFINLGKWGWTKLPTQVRNFIQKQSDDFKKNEHQPEPVQVLKPTGPELDKPASPVAPPQNAQPLKLESIQ